MSNINLFVDLLSEELNVDQHSSDSEFFSEYGWKFYVCL